MCIEVRLEAFAGGGGGQAALLLVAEQVDLVRPVGAWRLGLGPSELQEVDDDLLEERFAGLALAVARGLDLFGQMLEVERAVLVGGAQGAQLFCLAFGPGDEILLVEVGGDHASFLARLTRPAKLPTT